MSYQRINDRGTGLTYYGGGQAMGDLQASDVADIWKQLLGQAQSQALAPMPTLPSGTNPNVTANGVTITAADFNSTKYPGICKPLNKPALMAIQELQRQLNRIAHVKKLSKVAVDGDLGPKTLALLRQCQTISGGAIMGDASSCSGVAPDVDVIGDQARVVADDLGAPATVSGSPSLKTPTFIDPKTGADVKVPALGSSLAGAFGDMPLPLKIGFVGILGGIGYYAFGLNKKSKSKGRR